MIGRDRTYRWSKMIVGFNIPRWFIRGLSKRKLEKLINYVRYVWYTANDNNPRRVARPSWLPKKWC